MSGNNRGRGVVKNNRNQEVRTNLNINSPEFVPQNVSRFSNAVNNGNTSGSLKAEITMMIETFKKTNIDDLESITFGEKFGLELESRLASSDAVDLLGEAFLATVSKEPDCVSAAVRLATCLSHKITADDRPELRCSDHLLDNFPFFCALTKALDCQLIQLKERVSSSISPSKSDSALLHFLSGFYAQCGSPADPTSRFSLLATHLLRQLESLLGLHGNKDAHDTVVQVLLNSYRILDQDVVSNSEPEVESIDRQLLENIYETLRMAVAYNRCGSVDTALKVIHLLEERAKNCGLSETYFSNLQSNFDDLSMTDEMFDDYESFLLTSGQISGIDNLQNGF